jgi:hypothetical protein
VKKKIPIAPFDGQLASGRSERAALVALVLLSEPGSAMPGRWPRRSGKSGILG